jgi:murein DD-endopeptidase MepM/ murein hydrolase activator NlpD
MRAAVTLTAILALQTAAPAETSELQDRLSRLGHVFDDVEVDLLPDGVGERLVRWNVALRNFVHDTATVLAAHAPALPDVSVLTTEPVANTESSGFGWRDDPIRHRAKFHSGTDFRGKHGTPVVAAGPGVVVFAGRRGGYGNVVFIDHGHGVVTRYGHMRKIETKVGSVLTAGTRIGQVGSTGRATGPHLHFEVRLDGRDVDPNTALVVAEISRESSELGHLASYALSPELQKHSRDMQDTKNRRALESRPERKNAPKRERALW